MINAFLDFVSVVNRQRQKKDDHQFVSVSVTSTREKPLDTVIRNLQCLLRSAPGRPLEEDGTSDGPYRAGLIARQFSLPLSLLCNSPVC
jgi:hypothetical protein